MPLFQRYQVAGVKKLIDLHICPFCIMRLSNVENRSIYLMSEKEAIEYIAKELNIPSSELVFPDFICATCMNLLREKFFEKQLQKMNIPTNGQDPRYVWYETMVNKCGVKDIHEFYVEVSNLTTFMIRHYSIINYLVINYNLPMEIIYNLWSVRDILRSQGEEIMQKLIPGSKWDMNAIVRIRLGLVHFETNNDFLQLPGSFPDQEDLEIDKIIKEEHEKGNYDLHEVEEAKLVSSSWFNSSIKTQRVILKTRHNTPPSVESKLQKLQYTQYPDSIICPPQSPSYEPTIGLSIYRKSIYITGNYLKLKRGLSQTPWIVDGERKTEGSVEEYILSAFKEAQVYKFHSAGREDVDVRMLCEGRPFVIEMEDSKRCDLSKEEYLELENRINSSTKEIQVMNLRRCTAAGFDEMKNAAEGKHKLYVAVVFSETEITPELIAKLDTIQDLVIHQKTPVRVLHRRSLLTRDKTIYKMKTTFINNHHFILEIEASGGAYIKEFVHGDLGRTRPNVCEILNVDCDILQLDVKAVVGVNIQ